MSETNLTEFKQRIAAGVAERGLGWGASKVSRLAVRLHKRGLRMADLDLERILMHSDPTPKQAIRNIERQAVTA